MDNMNLINKLPPMLSGSELEQALTILPEYDPAIVEENEAMRLIRKYLYTVPSAVKLLLLHSYQNSHGCQQ